MKTRKTFNKINLDMHIHTFTQQLDAFTLKNAGLFLPNFGSNMTNPEIAFF